MSSQRVCRRECVVTLVAFVWLFSTVCFQKSLQIACINWCKITLVAFFVWSEIMIVTWRYWLFCQSPWILESESCSVKLFSKNGVKKYPAATFCSDLPKSLDAPVRLLCWVFLPPGCSVEIGEDNVRHGRWETRPAEIIIREDNARRGCGQLR